MNTPMRYPQEPAPSPLEQFGTILLRYGLVVTFLWFGVLKFTDYEAAGVAPFAITSPLLSWAFAMLGTEGFARALGAIEIAIGLAIAMRPFAPGISALGSFGAIVTFLITLSLLLTTPGVIEPGYQFPALSAKVGQFLIKDTSYLAAAVYTAGEALSAAQRWSQPGLAHRANAV